MNLCRTADTKMAKSFRFIMYLTMLVLMSCAAATVDKQLHGEHEGLEVFIDGPRESLLTFQLMRSGVEIWLKGPMKRPASKGEKPLLLDSSKVQTAVSVIAQAYHSGAIDFSTINDFSEIYARAKATLSNDGKRPVVLTYVEIGRGIFKLSDGKHGGLILDPVNNWVFRAPVRYASNAITAIDLALRRVAFTYCGDYPKEENSCTVSAFDIEARSTEQLMEVTGNVEDMKFSCDGKSLYILTRQFSVKSGPIDSLFAFAGHPNSDNWYRLTIFSLHDRKDTFIDVEGEYPPGGGYLVQDCDEK